MSAQGMLDRFAQDPIAAREADAMRAAIRRAWKGSVSSLGAECERVCDCPCCTCTCKDYADFPELEGRCAEVPGRRVAGGLLV